MIADVVVHLSERTVIRESRCPAECSRMPHWVEGAARRWLPSILFLRSTACAM